MAVDVWPYHQAACDRCPDWRPPHHLSPMSAQDDADLHEEWHREQDEWASIVFAANLPDRPPSE